MTRPRPPYFGVIAIVACTLAVTASLLRDRLVAAWSSPPRSFSETSLAAAPDFAKGAAWHRWNDGEGPADLFYLESATADASRAWNAPFDDTDVALSFDTRASLEVGPFRSVGPLFAPRLRQPSRHARRVEGPSSTAAFSLAAEDAVAAFDLFLAKRDARRPIVIVAHGAGADIALALLEQRFADPAAAHAKMLAGAYLVGARDKRVFPPACVEPTDVRCVVAHPETLAGAKTEGRPARAGAQVSGTAFLSGQAENVRGRVDALLALLEEEAQVLEPIRNSIDIGDSPINKVPD